MLLQDMAEASASYLIQPNVLAGQCLWELRQVPCHCCRDGALLKPPAAVDIQAHRP